MTTFKSILKQLQSIGVSMASSTYRTIILSSILLTFVLLSACSDAFRAEDPDDTITISGQVIDQSNGQPVASALVEITSPTEFQQSTTTDEQGQYTFTITTNESVTLTIEASKTNYETTTQNLTASPGADITEVNLSLTTTSDGDGGVGGEAEEPAAIILTNNPLQAINIKETGDVVSAPFTFQVQDSAGRALNASQAVDVEFSLINSPGGAEDVVPKVATTNDDGEVTTTLFSGNKAGTVKLQARVVRELDGAIIKSSPVLIAIHGGFPDENHFSIGVDKFNFEGYSRNNIRNTVTVIAGDKFSNPVKPGTVVYFETTGGIIQGSGPTDDDGVVEADIISGDPRPNDDIPGSDGRPGYATVTASTVDENDNTISKDVVVVFSTSSAHIDASPLTFDLAPNGGETFNYTVEDLNGNPMAAGTQITIDAGDGIEVSGDADFTLGNNLFPGSGSTDFSFSIRDTDDESNEPADLTIQITVTSPSGNATTFSGISGTRR